ncbi:MAG: amidohydrolase family protein [Candidatus Nanopelagicales bacterium]
MEQTRARLVLTSASVYSPTAPFATAIIIDGDQVAWIGDDGGLTQQLLDSDRIVDGAGLFAAPAFFDAHAIGSVEQLTLPQGVAAAQAFAQAKTSSEDTASMPTSRPPANSGASASTLVTIGIEGELTGELELPADPRRIDAVVATDAACLNQLQADRTSVVLPATALAAGALARLTRAGIPTAAGSFGATTSPWEWIRQAVFAAEEGVSARAAFGACTRSGWRLIGRPERGQLVVGAQATIALWRAPDLTVQTADERVAAWSTDPRSGTPPLPDLTPGRDLPEFAGFILGAQTNFAAQQ